jgi:hypothetical protein
MHPLLNQKGGMAKRKRKRKKKRITDHFPQKERREIFSFLHLRGKCPIILFLSFFFISLSSFTRSSSL